MSGTWLFFYTNKTTEIENYVWTCCVIFAQNVIGRTNLIIHEVVIIYHVCMFVRLF